MTPLTFETDRCELRPVSPGDTNELHRLWITPGVRKFLWDDEIISLERAAEAVAMSLELFARDRFGLWAVRRKGSQEICGFAGLWPFRDPPEIELLYGVAEPLWGQGYAVEVSQAILTYCYDTLGMSVVRASINAPHVASARVLEKLGFTRVRQGTVDGSEHIFFERARLGGDAPGHARP
jgi:ribosomal-protein-alanine N-acetyltransferase